MTKDTSLTMFVGQPEASKEETDALKLSLYAIEITVEILLV